MGTQAWCKPSAYVWQQRAILKYNSIELVNTLLNWINAALFAKLRAVVIWQKALKELGPPIWNLHHWMLHNDCMRCYGRESIVGSLFKLKLTTFFRNLSSFWPIGNRVQTLLVVAIIPNSIWNMLFWQLINSYINLEQEIPNAFIFFPLFPLFIFVTMKCV